MSSGKKTAARPARTPASRLVVALCAILSAAGCIVASLLSWFSVHDAVGRTTISGWGIVSGGQIDGQNINGLGGVSFRPGGFAVVVGGLALLAAAGIALVARGRQPHRIPAAVLVLCGAGGLAWGLYRGLSPGTLNGAYSAGEVSSGPGPWLTAGCSVVLLAAGVVVFTGVLDPPKPLGRPGIQPR